MAQEPATPEVWIAAKRDGHRRAGIAHGTQPRLHPAGTFTADQLDQLEADLVLFVERVTGSEKVAPAGAIVAAKAPAPAVEPKQPSRRAAPRPLPLGPGDVGAIAAGAATRRLRNRPL